MSALFVTRAHGAIETLECVPLRELSVPHGFTTRGKAFGKRENGARDRELLAKALGFSRLAPMRQLHGGMVRELDRVDPLAPECDGLVTDRVGIGVVVQTADCVPLLLWASKKNAVAAVHAGWRGTLAGVASEAVVKLCAAFGAAASEIHVAIGPAIGGCCFEVGDEVVEAFETRGRDVRSISRPGPRGRRHLDLVAENRRQLRETGVRDGQIYDAGRCTYCEVDRFYSFRREGSGVGRLLGAIGVR